MPRFVMPAEVVNTGKLLYEVTGVQEAIDANRPFVIACAACSEKAINDAPDGADVYAHKHPGDTASCELKYPGVCDKGKGDPHPRGFSLNKAELEQVAAQAAAAQARADGVSG